jgi:hypothetical protein
MYEPNAARLDRVAERDGARPGSHGGAPEATEAPGGAQLWPRTNASEPSDAADGRHSGGGGGSFAWAPSSGQPPIGGSWGMVGVFDQRIRPPRTLPLVRQACPRLLGSLDPWCYIRLHG